MYITSQVTQFYCQQSVQLAIFRTVDYAYATWLPAVKRNNELAVGNGNNNHASLQGGRCHYQTILIIIIIIIIIIILILMILIILITT